MSNKANSPKGVKVLSAFLKKYVTAEKIIARFATVWVFLCTLECIWLNRRGFNMMTGITGVSKLSLAWHLLALTVMFFVYYCVCEKMMQAGIEKMILFAFMLVYSVICVKLNQDFYFSCGVILAMGFTCVYCMKDVRLARWDIPKATYIVAAVVIACVFVGFLGLWGVTRYRTYSSPNFDFGIFSQMFHYMKTHFSMETTLERDELLSHMKVHVSPAYWLMLPFYIVYPHPETLQVLQAVVLALGAVPLALICRKHSFNRMQMLIAQVMYLFWPVLAAGCDYDLHENCFLPVAILWMIYEFECDGTAGLLLSVCLTLLVKEDAAVYVAVVALFMVLQRKMYRKGGIVFALAVIYFMIAVMYLNVNGTGTLTFRYDNIIYGKDGSIIGMLKTMLTNPGFIMTQLLNQDNFSFILQVFVPLLFMPLCMNDWRRLVLFLPMVVFNLLPDYEYSASIHYQYVFGPGVLVFYVLVCNLGDMKREWQDIFLITIAVSCVISFVSVMGGKASLVDRYNTKYFHAIYDKMDEALALIPKDASVTATTYLCAHLADRDEVYEYHYTTHKSETDYVALDLRTATTEYDVNTYLYSEDYETVYYEEMCIGVFKRVQ